MSLKFEAPELDLPIGNNLDLRFQVPATATAREAKELINMFSIKVSKMMEIAVAEKQKSSLLEAVDYDKFTTICRGPNNLLMEKARGLGIKRAPGLEEHADFVAIAKAHTLHSAIVDEAMATRTRTKELSAKAIQLKKGSKETR